MDVTDLISKKAKTTTAFQKELMRKALMRKPVSRSSKITLPPESEEEEQKKVPDGGPSSIQPYC